MDNSLASFVEYEYRSSERYRRYMSLVMLRVPGEGTSFNALAGDLVRTSDKVFGANGTVAILMGETPLTAVKAAVTRFATRCVEAGGLQCGAAGFPQDASNAADFLSTAFRRYEIAKKEGSYAFVWSG